jgi:putative ABC transport system permease protein
VIAEPIVLVTATIGQPQFQAALVAFFAGAALFLAAIGIFGVVAYSTAQRTQEIGIRMALGAVPWDVRRLVLRQGVAMVLVGVAIGLVVTLVATTVMGRMIVLVSTTDPITFVTVTSALVIAALVACYLPARRATRVEPVTVLRQE